MKKIYKSKQEKPVKELTADKLSQYLRQTIKTDRFRKAGRGTLTLLAPLAASALLSNQVNAQCITQTQILNRQFLDIDENGLASFVFASSGPSLLFILAGDPFYGGENGLVYVNSNLGFNYAANIGSATNVIAGLATINFYNYAGANIPLPGSGTITVIDHLGNQHTVSLIIAPGSILIPFVDGNPTFPCSALPIELTKFGISVKENSLQLNWETATESNNSGFEVERSTDGIHFYKIGWIDGEGTTTDAQNYGFEDTQINANVLYYYRLQQMDFDGTKTLTDIVSGKVEGENPVQFGDIYPNPVGIEDARIEVIVKEGGQLTYTLYDQLGKSVLEGNSDLGAGLNYLQIPVQALAAGSYYLKVHVGEETSYKKFVKG